MACGGEIDVFVGGVHIAADHDAAAFFPLLLRMLQDRLGKLELVGHSLEVVAAVGKVPRVEEEVAVVGDDQPAFAVETVLTEPTEDDLLRGAPGVERTPE